MLIDAHFQFRQISAQEVDGRRVFRGSDISATGHDDVGFAGFVVAGHPRSERRPCNA